jgi:hypothetical protein
MGLQSRRNPYDALFGSQGHQSGQSRRRAASASIVYINERICRPGTIFSLLINLIMNGFKVTHYRHFWQTLAVVIADAIFFSTINASVVAPVVLIIGFVLLLLTCYVLLYGLLSIARLYGFPVRYKQRLAVYLSGIVGLIMALQSIGELTPRDILVLLPLATLGYVYAIYTTARKRNLDS